MRDHAYRRAVRQKWINRRVYIVRNIWLEPLYPWLKGGSRLSKYNFAHGKCGVCQQDRYRDTRHLEETKWLRVSGLGPSLY